MTCGMLVAVHRTSDISFSNNHSTYVHLSTLSPSLIALIRLRLVKDASKSRTVDYLKRVYVYTYRTENFIQNFIIYYSFYITLIFKRFCYYILSRVIFIIWNPSFTSIVSVIFIIECRDTSWKRSGRKWKGGGWQWDHFRPLFYQRVRRDRGVPMASRRENKNIYIYKGDRERRGRF